MRRLTTTYIFLIAATLPSLAWAGGPPGDSPEPSFWVLAALGVIPILYMIVRQLRSEKVEAAKVRIERSSSS